MHAGDEDALIRLMEGDWQLLGNRLHYSRRSEEVRVDGATGRASGPFSIPGPLRTGVLGRRALRRWSGLRVGSSQAGRGAEVLVPAIG